jgi:hypothetical protein
VLRRIVGLCRDEVVEGWKRLHNVDLHNFYAGHVAHMTEMRNLYKILVRKLKGRNCSKALGIYGKIIF